LLWERKAERKRGEKNILFRKKESCSLRPKSQHRKEKGGEKEKAIMKKGHEASIPWGARKKGGGKSTIRGGKKRKFL